MVRSFSERLERLARHARRGYREARAHPERRAQAARWIREHPGREPALDEEWLRCLTGDGPLARWLESDASVDVWAESLALHSLLSSHPFADQATWSIQEMFGAS